MVVLGLLLVLLSGLLAAGIALSNTDPVVASAYGLSLSNISLGGFFAVGAATGLLFGLGLVIMAGGASRRRAKRRELKERVARERERHESLAQENAALQEQLERSGTATVTPAPVYPEEPTSVVSSGAADVKEAKHAGTDETSRFPR